MTTYERQQVRDALEHVSPAHIPTERERREETRRSLAEGRYERLSVLAALRTAARLVPGTALELAEQTKEQA